HTATGKHLAELEAKFADVGTSSRPSDLGEPVENLRNLGPTSAQWLAAVGIRTIGDLERIGAPAAHAMVKRVEPSASLNLLWALAAGLKDADWRDLSDAEKQRLRETLAGLER